MAGFVINAVPKRTVDFAQATAGVPQDVILADLVDILQWREATVLVKIHSCSVDVGAGYIAVGAYPQSVSAQDPAVEFLDRTTFPAIGIDSFTPSPYLSFFVAPVAPMIRIVAQGNRAAAGALIATLSIDVSVKDA